MRVEYDDVVARVIEHVERQLDRPVRGPVTTSSHLTRDLHLDSMESLQLLSDLEDHYGVTMPVQLFQRAETLGDVARGVMDALARHGD